MMNRLLATARFLRVFSAYFAFLGFEHNARDPCNPSTFYEWAAPWPADACCEVEHLSVLEEQPDCEITPPELEQYTLWGVPYTCQASTDGLCAEIQSRNAKKIQAFETQKTHCEQKRANPETSVRKDRVCRSADVNVDWHKLLFEFGSISSWVIPAFMPKIAPGFVLVKELAEVASSVLPFFVQPKLASEAPPMDNTVDYVQKLFQAYEMSRVYDEVVNHHFVIKSMCWMCLCCAVVSCGCVMVHVVMGVFPRYKPQSKEPRSDQAGQAAGGSLVNNIIIVKGQPDRSSMEDIKKQLKFQTEQLEAISAEMKAKEGNRKLLQDVLKNMCRVLHFKPQVIFRAYAVGLTHLIDIKCGRGNASVHDTAFEFFDGQDGPGFDPDIGRRAAIILEMMGDCGVLEDIAFRREMPHLVCDFNGRVQPNSTPVMFALQVAEQAGNSPEVIRVLKTYRDSQLALPPSRYLT